MLRNYKEIYFIQWGKTNKFVKVKNIANFLYEKDYIKINGVYYYLANVEFFVKNKDKEMVKIKEDVIEIIKALSNKLNEKEWKNYD